MHFNAAKSVVMHLGTKNIACICRVGGFDLRVPCCWKGLGHRAETQTCVSCVFLWLNAALGCTYGGKDIAPVHPADAMAA